MWYDESNKGNTKEVVITHYQWIACWLPFLVLWWVLYAQRKHRDAFLKARQKHRKEGIAQMEEIIRKFMNCPVVVTFLSEAAEEGEIVSYSDGWITFSRKGIEKAVNCDYIVKIEPQKPKKQKKQ